MEHSLNNELSPARRSQALAREVGPQRNDISLTEICAVIRKRKLAVLGCLGFTLALASLYCIMAPRKYEATARVVINPDNSNPLGIAMGDMNPFTDASLMQETQVRVMQSDAVAWDVIQQLKLDQNQEFAPTKKGERREPIEAITPLHRYRLLANFHGRLNVASVPKTALVELRFRSKDPKLAADIVNAVANVYMERNFRTRYNATMQASDWLAKQLDDLKAKAESSQQQFAEFQKKSGIIGMDDSSGPNGSSGGGAHSIIISQLEEQNRQLVSAQSERIVREARYREALSGDPKVIADTAPTATLQALQAEDADLKNQYAQLSAQYGNAYPRVVQLRTQLAQVDSALQAEAKNVRRRLESEYQASSKAEKMASDEVEKSKQDAYKMNEAGIQYIILKRDLEASRDLYEDLLKKLKEAGIVAGLKSTNVNVVDPAAIPVVPSEPRGLLSLMVAFLLGSTGGVGLALLLENLDTTISSPEQAETLANLPVLGVVPHIRLTGNNGTRPLEANEHNKPLSLVRPQSPFAEAFRALRTTLLLSAAGKPPQVLVVTSAVPSEGKTTTAINLAVTLAQYGRRVLLVDADMRRGCVQERMALVQADGLSRWLAGATDKQLAIASITGLPNLHVLSAGQRPPSPAELLGSDQMRDLVQQWRGEYDHIVLDTPPVLALTDAAILASMADGILLVARIGKTHRQALCRTRDLLGRVNARTLGVVLNDFDLNSSAYFSHYGYRGDVYGEYYGAKELSN
jgi:capsular exopolysaccharide synthesis family protein